MSEVPTKEGFFELLKKKRLRKEAADMKNGITSFDEMVKRSESQWKEIAGVANGIDIFNYLHPDQGKPHSFSIL
jgi:hypothetical protein